MSVEALADQATPSYGRFAGVPSRSELERFFFLDDHDRALLQQRRRPHNRLGFALQLGTVRFLGAFLADPLDAPSQVIEYVAGQLGVDPACVGAYTEREKTAYEHAWEIRRQYGYREFGEAELELREFLVARAWTSAEGPRALFDRRRRAPARRRWGGPVRAAREPSNGHPRGHDQASGAEGNR